MHRIIGALSATHRGGIYAGLERFAGAKPDTYGMDVSSVCFLDRIARCRLVFWGEIHSVPQIVAMQSSVMECMAHECNRLHVVLEHFSFDMQDILDNYTTEKIDFHQLVEQYNEIGSEGHDLQPYMPLLERSRELHPRVKLHAGFISRDYARMLMRTKNVATTLQAASEWIENTPSLATLLQGDDSPRSKFHYNLFESMVSGRDVHTEEPPGDNNFAKGIFKAQLLKDVAMAQKVSGLLNNGAENEKVLVIAGNGHISHYQGVPERVVEAHPELLDHCCVVTSHEWDVGAGDLSEGPNQVSSIGVLQHLRAGPPGANPADYLFVFQKDIEIE